MNNLLLGQISRAVSNGAAFESPESYNTSEAQVTVTAHAASPVAGGPRGDGTSVSSSEQWRVLRFNEVTRQSVSRVRISPPAGQGVGSGGLEALASCLAFPYLRAMAAAGSAAIEAAGLTSAAIGPTISGRRSPRALCIGMGGGSLPMFLAHHYPGMQIDVVELDHVVIAAALTAMGFPEFKDNITVQHADAADYLAVWGAAGREELFDLVFLDAFDGEDNVPAQLCTPGSPFMTELAASLHQGHGTLIMNLHGGPRAGPSLQRLLRNVFRRQPPDPGYDPDSSAGMSVQQIAKCFRAALLPEAGGEASHGSAFTVSVARQQNVILTVTRIPQLLEDDNGAPKSLQAAAALAAIAAKFTFRTDEIISRDYSTLN